MIRTREDRINWDNQLKLMTSTNSYVPRESIVPKSYDIHDNGGRPFRVDVNTECIEVHIEDDRNNDHLKFHDFVGYWYGFDSSICRCNGNSVLIKINDYSYIIVGWNIYSFTTTDVIQDYVSPIGNSDVPYPVAYGDTNIYFMGDDEYVNRTNLILPITVDNAENIYSEYYGHYPRSNNFQSHRIDNIRILQARLY